MKKAILLAACAMCFILPASAEAQFLKKLTKKLEEKAQQKLEKKADEQMDAILEGKPESEKKEAKAKSKAAMTFTVPKFASNIKGNLIIKDEGLFFEGLDWRLQVNKVDLNSVGSAVKKYGGDKITAPVDAYPPGYVVLTSLSEDGYLQPNPGGETMVDIYKFNKDTLNFAFRGTWHFIDPDQQDQPVAHEVFVLTKDIIDQRRETKNNGGQSSSSSSNFDASVFSQAEIEEIDALNGKYDFDQSMTINITAKRNESIEMKYYLSSKTPGVFCYSAPQMEQNGASVLTLFSPEGYSLLMDMGNMKIKRSISFKQIEKMNGGFSMDASDTPDFKKTGRSKTILNYTADEYKVTSEGKEIFFWVTEDETPVNRSFIPMVGVKKDFPLQGMVLEINGDGIVMQVTGINASENLSVDTTQYRSMGNMGGFFSKQ